MCFANRLNDPKCLLLRRIGGVSLIVFVLLTNVAPMWPGANSGWVNYARHFVAGMALGINLCMSFALARRCRARG